MNPNEPLSVELQSGETKVVGDLTITNASGGHKILMRSPHETDGDLPFAELTLKTPHVAETEVRVLNPRATEPGEVITFDTYTIVPEEVGWNGEFVRLKITGSRTS